MSDDERRTVIVTAGILLLASLLRFGWEARPVPPIFPPAGVPDALVEETLQELEREERMRTPLAPGERVDPNRDEATELARLPGVGPALAGRIVESRKVEGAFRASTDLLRVSGIGDATLQRIDSLLDLSDPPPLLESSPGPTPGSAGGSAGVVGGPRAPPSQPLGSEGPRVDLNRAGVDDLQALPGVGPAIAARIVEHREQIGRFTNPDQLLDVPGIGPATLERVRTMVDLGG